MRLFLMACVVMVAAPALMSLPASAAGTTPEVEACQNSGLIALKEQDKGVKDLVLDATDLTQSKADAKVGDTEVRTVILGDARIETSKADKPRKFVCLIGEKGKVLLTFFASPQG